MKKGFWVKKKCIFAYTDIGFESIIKNLKIYEKKKIQYIQKY